MTITDFALQHGWLIVALPVAAFALIAFAIIVAGKTQAVARAVAPWILICCLGAALLVALGALLNVMQHAPATVTEGHGAAAVTAVTHWPEQSITWLTPEPRSLTLDNGVLHFMDRTLRVGILLDPLACTMLVVVLLVSLLVQIYSLGYMKREEYPRFYLYMSLFTASMLGLVISSSLVQLFIFWELVGLCSYFLIGFWYTKPEAAKAAIKAFVVTRFGDLGLLFAVMGLWMGYGDLSFTHLQQVIHLGAVPPTTLPFSLTVVGILIFFGACGKSAQFPLHIWLPDAMEGPTSVSALIHAATMVAAGIFLVARMFFLYQAAPGALVVVALVGAFTALFAGSIALGQVDMKKVMAYSTISQLGYMMMGLGLAAPAAAFFHLTTHAFFKALLFLTAGSVIHSTHTQNMWEMGGLAKKMKVTAIACAIGGLALAGIVPFAGFFSKDKLMEAAWEAAMGQGAAAGYLSSGLAWLILIMALLTVLMTAFYTTRMWTLVFLGAPRSEGAKHAHESPPTMLFSLVTLAILTAVTGYLLAPRLAGLQWGNANEFSITTIGVIALAAAVVGILWGYRLYGTAPKREPLRALGALYTGMVNLWYVDAGFTWLAQHVVLALAHVVRRFDKQVIDGGLVDGTAWSTGRLGHQLRRLFAGPLPGQMQYYALVIFIIAALVILGMSAHAYTGAAMGVMGR